MKRLNQQHHKYRVPVSSAFTLVEVLVVIAIIALLVAITIPALAKARLAARDTQSFSTLRQLAASLDVYAQDQNDAFPMFADPGIPFFGYLHIHNQMVREPAGFFDSQAGLWLSVMIPEYLSPIHEDSIWTQSYKQLGSSDSSHNKNPSLLIHSAYMLSYTAFAEPRFWDDSSITRDDLRMLRGSHWRDLVYPSAKGLIWDLAGTASTKWSKARALMLTAFADGSAGVLNDGNTDSSLFVTTPYTGDTGPVVTTKDGMAGRDKK